MVPNWLIHRRMVGHGSAVIRHDPNKKVARHMIALACLEGSWFMHAPQLVVMQYRVGGTQDSYVIVVFPNSYARNRMKQGTVIVRKQTRTGFPGLRDGTPKSERTSERRLTQQLIRLSRSPLSSFPSHGLPCSTSLPSSSKNNGAFLSKQIKNSFLSA